MELLPAERDTRSHKRAQLDAAHAATARRSHRRLRAGTRRRAARRRCRSRRSGSGCTRRRSERGPVTLLSARVTAGSATPVVDRVRKNTASAFERLTLAARAWKELGAAAARACAARAHRHGCDAERRGSRSAGRRGARRDCPDADDEVEAGRSAPRSLVTLLSDGAAPDLARALAIDRGNHLARWLTALPPNVLNSPSYRRALRDARAPRGLAILLPRRGGVATAGRRRIPRRRARERSSRRRHRAPALPRRRATHRIDAGGLALVGKGICFDTGGINLKIAQEHVPHARGHAGQRRRRRHAARAERARGALRHRLLARDHRERDRRARVSAAGSRAALRTA